LRKKGIIVGKKKGRDSIPPSSREKKKRLNGRKVVSLIGGTNYINMDAFAQKGEIPHIS